LGDNGLPFKPVEYDFPQGMGMIDLPENALNKFCIGIAEDLNNKDSDDFSVSIPYIQV
jgi:hypothetical protein